MDKDLGQFHQHWLALIIVTDLQAIWDAGISMAAYPQLRRTWFMVNRLDWKTDSGPSFPRNSVTAKGSVGLSHCVVVKSLLGMFPGKPQTLSPLERIQKKNQISLYECLGNITDNLILKFLN